MNYSNYRFTLDIQSNLSQVSLPVKLNDSGRRLLIGLTDGGNPYQISKGSLAKFTFKKSEPNSEGVYESGLYDCVLEDNYSTIRFDLTRAVTGVAGVVDCEVRLYGPNGRLITSPRFIIVVDDRVIYDDDIPLTDEQASTIDAIILSEAQRVEAEKKRVKAEVAREETLQEAIVSIDQSIQEITPSIGDNGNWFIGEEDTGTPATGEVSSEAVTVTVTGNDSDGYSADMTFADILAKVSEGKVVQVQYFTYLYSLSFAGSSLLTFSLTSHNPYTDDTSAVYTETIYIHSSDVVSMSHHAFDNSSMEVSTVHVTASGNEDEGYSYSADATFDDILAWEDEGKVIQVVLGSLTYSLSAKNGDFSRTFTSVSTHVDEEDGYIAELSHIRFFSNGMVTRQTYEFEPPDYDYVRNLITNHNKSLEAHRDIREMIEAIGEGANGVSPTVAVTEIDGGHCITITDAEGVKTFDVKDGADGYTPVKGKDYFDGRTPEKGVDYFDGEDGEDGISVTVASVSESNADGGSNVVTFTDGNTLTVKNGRAGKDGTTPKKGEDYFDGVDGVSPAVSVANITGGHRISITDKSGTKTVDVLNGTKGDSGRGINSVARTSGTGAAGTTDTYTITYTDNTTSTFTVYNGKNGSNGTSVTIKSVSDSTVDGGSNIVTFSDGNTLTIKNGSKGSPGTSVTVSNVTNSSADGGNNVVTFSDGKTLTVKNGKTGGKGDTGKSAYAYAQDGGYTGTEAEFSAMLAGDVIPAYWESHIANKIATIKALQDSGKDCFSFAVIADLHYSQNLGKRSPTLAKRIMDECNIRFALTLGDYQSRGSWSSKASAVEELENVQTMLSPLAGHLLVQQGNHDGSWGDALNGVTYPYNLTPAELYNRIHAMTYAHVDAVTDESGTGYYVDDKARKVRYVMLNSQNNKYETDANGAKYNNMRVFRFTQAQYDFLINDALKVEDGWKIVVAAHAPISNAYGELFNGGEAQSAKGDHTMMRGLLTAYRNKKTYADSWNGTAGSGVAYTNLANPSTTDSSTTANLTNWKIAMRVNSSKAYTAVTTTDKNNQQITNLIALNKTGKYHIRGMNVYDKTTADSSNNNRIIFTDASGAVKHAVQTSSSAWSACYSVASYDSNVTIIDIAKTIAKLNESGGFDSSATHIRFGGYTTDKDSVVITLNENIDDNNVLTGYDAVSVNADFTSYKGELVGYFSGHAHNDYNYAYADWGIPIITTRCDGASENVSSLLNERVSGSVTEQSFDVFTINPSTRKIYATKIGAGSDRVIDY